MDRIVITIRPSPSEEGLLRVDDAMQQVIDLIKLLNRAERAMIAPGEAFEWRFKRATTNSPFTVEAIAEPINPAVNISAQVQLVKEEVARGLSDLISTGHAPIWMDQDAIQIARGLFTRNRNGIGRTDFDFDGATLSIGREEAETAIRTIDGISLL